MTHGSARVRYALAFAGGVGALGAMKALKPKQAEL